MKEKNPNHSCRPGEALSPFLCPEKHPYFTIVTPNHFYLIMINAPTFQNVLSLFSTTSTCIEWRVSTIISSSNNSFDTKSLIWDSDHVHCKVLYTPPHPETIPPNPIPLIDSTEGDGVFIPIIIGVNDKEYLRPGWNKSASSDQGFSCPVVFSRLAFTWQRWKWLFNKLFNKLFNDYSISWEETEKNSSRLFEKLWSRLQLMTATRSRRRTNIWKGKSWFHG